MPELILIIFAVVFVAMLYLPRKVQAKDLPAFFVSIIMILVGIMMLIDYSTPRFSEVMRMEHTFHQNSLSIIWILILLGGATTLLVGVIRKTMHPKGKGSIR